MSLRGSTPNTADVILMAIDAARRRMHTALPGKVLEYDAATQTATVQPMVQQGVQDEDGYWTHETLPEIYDVPVMFLRSPSFTLTFPIPVGTTGQIVFNERDIGQWRHTGQCGSPGDQRCHSLAGAVFFPTMAPDDSVAAVSAEHAVLAVTGVSTKLLLGGPTATQFVALAEKVDAELAKIATAFSTFLPGSGGASFPDAYVEPTTVAATKVKAL